MSNDRLYRIMVNRFKSRIEQVSKLEKYIFMVKGEVIKLKELNKRIRLVVSLSLFFIVLILAFDLNDRYYYVMQGITAALMITYIVLLFEYLKVRKERVG